MLWPFHGQAWSFELSREAATACSPTRKRGVYNQVKYKAANAATEKNAKVEFVSFCLILLQSVKN